MKLEISEKTKDYLDKLSGEWKDVAQEFAGMKKTFEDLTVAIRELTEVLKERK